MELVKYGRWSFTCICGHGLAGDLTISHVSCSNCGEGYEVQFDFQHAERGEITLKMRAQEMERAAAALEPPNVLAWNQSVATASPTVEPEVQYGNLLPTEEELDYLVEPDLNAEVETESFTNAPLPQ